MGYRGPWSKTDSWKDDWRWSGGVGCGVRGSSLKPIHLSNEKRGYPGCLGDLLGIILSSYIGIIINHCKDHY